MPYVTLEAGKRWLKPIGSLEDDSEDGITQDDLDAAEREAMQITKGTIGWMYDISDWDDETPPIVEQANELLASAIVVDIYLNRDTDVTVGTEYLPDKLWARGEGMLEKVLKGDYHLLDRNDDPIERLRIAPRQSASSRVSKAHFYPDRNSQTSFGKRARFTAERVFKET